MKISSKVMGGSSITWVVYGTVKHFIINKRTNENCLTLGNFAESAYHLPILMEQFRSNKQTYLYTQVESSIW